jgi:hypothetical protein
MMFALSVLDLPLRSVEHEVTFNDVQLVLTAKSPAIVFHEEIRPADPLEDATPVLVSQNFFRLDDRYRSNSRPVRRPWEIRCCGWGLS